MSHMNMLFKVIKLLGTVCNCKCWCSTTRRVCDFGMVRLTVGCVNSCWILLPRLGRWNSHKGCSSNFQVGDLNNSFVLQGGPLAGIKWGCNPYKPQLPIWVLIFFPSYFKWTYGNPSAGPSAQLPRPAFLLPREQVQNSSFRELPRSRFF